MHAVTCKSGRLVSFRFTPGQRGDTPLGETLLEGFEPGEVGTIIADAACDSDRIRDRGRRLKAKVCIKPNPRRTRQKRYDKTIYKHRNQIERFLGRIKRCRRIATHYEKKPTNFVGFLWLAALVTDLIWMSVLPSRGQAVIQSRNLRQIIASCKLLHSVCSPLHTV